MSALLLGGCAREVSSPLEKADRITIPAVKQYTRAQMTKAADEMDKNCPTAPILCELVNDYGRMRDQSRAALDLQVDTTR